MTRITKQQTNIFQGILYLYSLLKQKHKIYNIRLIQCSLACAASSPVYDVRLKGKDCQWQVIKGNIVLLVEEAQELVHNVVELVVPPPLEVVQVEAFVHLYNTMCYLQWLLCAHPVILYVGCVNASDGVDVVSLVANRPVGVVIPGTWDAAVGLPLI